MKNSVVGKIGMIFLLLVCASVQAQDKEGEREKIRQLEEQKKNEKQRAINQTLDSAVVMMETGAHAEADVKFLFVLKNIKSVPSDLAYYFGENSYHLGKYKQSVDWLNKYIQLKGASGKYSEKAVERLKESESKLLEEKQTVAIQAQEILSRDYDIDCGPSGKVNCPVCGGSKVIVKKTYLGETYKACTHCHEKGYLTCEEYNKLLRGQLKIN
jgi:hypothetical protein